MKYLFFLVIISFLAFNPTDQKAKSDVMQLLKEVKKENFDLDQLKSTLKENFCSKLFFETDEELECKLEKSISKKLKAKKLLKAAALSRENDGGSDSAAKYQAVSHLPKKQPSDKVAEFLRVMLLEIIII